MSRLSTPIIIGTAAVIGLGAGALWSNVEGRQAQAQPAATMVSIAPRVFSLCHTGGGTNCVVDGDTIWVDAVKIRIADIDAPETHPPRCDQEAELGRRATGRLLQLVNAGPFEMRALNGRDADLYGRKLRVFLRNGQSLGDQLVREGLARAWSGRREPWC
ncbi:putative nuclease [Sphingobium sp. SYK-6]|uniref:thermonuclease family protein n=1 Tax=Sphingobium sp. (strain NBRC 103272 / SYK-6) TaxID=627192 RepID=UPI0002276F20|nr:putative nuclease [Sphingobium sp. SYK-6]